MDDVALGESEGAATNEDASVLGGDGLFSYSHAVESAVPAELPRLRAEQVATRSREGERKGEGKGEGKGKGEGEGEGEGGREGESE